MNDGSNDPRWQQIDALFDEALGIEASARAAFLDERCPDPELSHQILQLLERVDTHSSFLRTGGGVEASPSADEPARSSHPPPEPARSPAPGGESALGGLTGEDNRIANYRLIEQIGSGGMGEVWKAEQDSPIRRLVALKLIKLGMDSREVVARFESERQALALMNHPSIARVFDGGVSATGRPFFVMELVRGAPITQYCDLNKLTTRERLRLFIQVCAGVQHAHQKGIIHRDIKPTNVLVTTEGGPPVPKIIDFGVARAVDHRLSESTLHTKLGQIIGTPGYMSPEQIEMDATDVDTRTDVYALGVLLYELLTSLRPFDPKELARLPFEDLRRTIREHEPPRPSSRVEQSREDAIEIERNHGRSPEALAAQLRGDLDWIVTKAIEKDRTNRYGSPQELADDVRRHLEDQPVTASPPSALYRIDKFARRHRTAFALSASIAFGIVAASVALIFALVQSHRHQARIEAALAEAQFARDEAEAVTQFLSDMLTAATPGREGRDVTVREVLDQGATDVDQSFSPESLVGAELRRTMGTVYDNLGFLDEARPLLEEAVEIAARVDPDGPVHASALESLALLDSQTGAYEAARGRFQRCLAILESQTPRDTLAISAMLTNLSSLYTETGEHAEAARVLERALAYHESQFGPDHPHVAGAYNNVAVLYKEAGDYERARHFFGRAQKSFDRSLGPDHPWNLTLRSNISGVLVAEGKLDEALALDQEVLEARERTLGADHPDVALSLSNLAELFSLLGRHDDGLAAADRALEIRQRKLGPSHQKVATTLRVRAEIFERLDRLSDARLDLERALGIDERLGLPDAQAIRDDVEALLRVARASGDTEEETRLRSRFPALTRAAGEETP